MDMNTKNEATRHMEYEITGDEFHETLKKIIEEKVSVDELLSISGVYEALSEEYNNKVLDVWEQKDFDKKLYSFTIREKNGEREYSVKCLVEAKSPEEAQKKAMDYCSGWYLDDPTSRYDVSEEVYYFDNECVSIVIENLTETSRGNWIRGAYRDALIG